VTVPRLVITIEVEGGRARARLENVDSPADAARLRHELDEWPVRAEVRAALVGAWRELTRLANANAQARRSR
jgi:hypothetical protein